MESRVSLISKDHVIHGCQPQMTVPSAHGELENVSRENTTNTSDGAQSVKNNISDHAHEEHESGSTTENGYTTDRNPKIHEEFMDAVLGNSGSTKHIKIACNYKPEGTKDLNSEPVKLEDTTDITIETTEGSNVGDINRSYTVKSDRAAKMNITLVDESGCIDDSNIACLEVLGNVRNRSITHLVGSESEAIGSIAHPKVSKILANKSVTHLGESAVTEDIIIKTSEELEITQDIFSNAHSHLESQTGQSIIDQVESIVNDQESDEPSEDLHTTKLGKICRICGEMTVKYDGPKKGVPKHEIVKHVKKVWNVDISDENSDIYPVNVCLSCERKIKRLYSKISKRKKCELFRKKLAEFVEHSDNDCAVCLLKEESPSPSPQLLSWELSQVETDAVIEDDKSQICGSEIEGNTKCQMLLELRRNSTRKRSWEDQGVSIRTVGCQTDLDCGLENMTGLEEHDYTQDEAISHFHVSPKKLGGRTPYQKQSLSSVNAKYIRQDRLKPLIAHIDKFCQLHKEDKIDAMFFLLMQTLRDAGDRTRENLVLNIWCKKNNVGMSLSEEECLAKRILLKQTKDQYRKEYSYYKEKLEKSVLKPPFIVDRLEKTYFPEHLEYFVTDGESGPVIYQHEKSTYPSYFTITDSQDGTSKADGVRAGVVGARWRYFDAVAKTLEELTHSLENEIQELDEDTCIKVDMCDYCEEKRDFTNFSDKTDSSGNGRRVQSKMITYFFGVQSMQAIKENKMSSIYKSNPNAVQFRPLMKALVAEGNALHPTIRAVDEERVAMIDKVFHITLPNGTPLNFLVCFTNALLEVRKDYRNISGLTFSTFKKVPLVINRYGSICLELKRSWLATSPRLLHVSRVTNSRTKCSRCGEQGHNVRKCSLPLDNGTGSIQNKKRKKQRTIPSPSYSTPVAQTSQIFTKDSKILDMGSQQQQQHPHHHHHQHHQHQHHHPQQEPQDTLTHLATGATNIDQNTAVIRGDDQILWTCPTLGSTPSHIGTHAPQSSQVLIPSPATSSSSEYQSVAQRSHAQISQGTSAPVYVWTYTVVQPQHGASQHHPQQLSLIHHQPAQQAVSQQPQQLSVVHQQSVQQETSQQHQQISVVHQQSAQPGTSQQHQQVSVVHQQSGQPPTSQQSQHLSVIHPQSSQQPPSQQTPLSVVHQQQIQRPSPQQQTTPQLNLITQQSNHPQAVQQSQQQLSVVHQQPASQPQLSVVHQQPASQPQLSVVHQQQSSQSTNIIHQQGQQAEPQTAHPESSPQQQLIHPQSSELQSVIDQW